jgi:hypothetical protein
MKEDGIKKLLMEDRQNVVREMDFEIQKMADDFNAKKGSTSYDWIPNYERPPQY